MTKAIILDLETSSLDINTAKVIIFGAYDPISGDFTIRKWGARTIAEAMQLFKDYDYIITFNGLQFDLPVLKHNGIDVKNKHIDLKILIESIRKDLIRPGGFTKYSLDNIIKELGLDISGKLTINYELFNKKEWTNADQEEIITYCKQDLLLTAKLWNYIVNRFKDFNRLLSEKDQNNFKNIITNESTYIYKALCNLAQVEELYEQKHPIKITPKAYVTTPKKERIEGEIILLQFTNLYLNTIVQFNLVSGHCTCCPVSSDGKFHGKNYYLVNGFYCQKSLGRMEKALWKLEDDISKLDPIPEPEQLICNKILSVFTNPKYYTIYDKIAAEDCPALVRQQLDLTAKAFKDKGFNVIYIDTDKIFIHMDTSANKSVSELLLYKDIIVKALQSKMPFPTKLFKLEHVSTIKWLQFLKESWSPIVKKTEYFYITKEGKAVGKNVSKEVIMEIVKARGTNG